MPQKNPMKYMTLCSLFALFLGIEFGYAQAFQFKKNFQNVPLSEVLATIEGETEFYFAYSSSAIATDATITAVINDSTIEGVLEKVFAGTGVEYEVMRKRILLKKSQQGQTVRGRVIDRHTRIPILGATVVLVGSNPLKGDATDAGGHFRIEHVQNGRYTVKASYLGYREELMASVLVGSGQEVILDIEMEESLTELGEIYVGVSNVQSSPVNDMTQVSGRSFTVEETKRYPVSIGDPLRLASSFAGVLATDDGGNDVVVRGNSPRGLLWMLEGVEIPSPNHFSSEGASTGAISMFSTQVISRSDFLTSAFPAQYGNATAGVFDIQLRNGNNERRETTIQLGLLGLDFASEGPLSPKKSASYLFNYRYSTLAMLDGIGLPLMEEGEGNVFQDLSFKVHIPTENAGTFSVFGLGGLSSYTYNYKEDSDEEMYNMGVIGISNKYQLSTSAVLKSTVSWSGTEVSDKYISPANGAPGLYKDNTTFKKGYFRGSMELNKKFNAQHFISSGFTASYLNFDFVSKYQIPQNSPPYDVFDEFDDQGNSGSFQAFTTWKYRPHENLTLVNGLHVLHFFLSQETVVEPRSNIRWQYNPKFAVFGGFGLHSRIESLEYYFANYIREDGSSVDLNADLKVTRASHYVTGFDAQLSSKTYLKTEFYYQYLYNVPIAGDSVYPGSALANTFSTINISDGYVIENLANGGTGFNYGVEVSLERKFADGYFFLLNGMLYQSKYKGRDRITRDTRFNGNFGYNMLAGREFTLGKGSRNNILGFNLKLTHAGNKRYTPIDVQSSIAQHTTVRNAERQFENRFPDYFRTDVQISYRKNLRNRTIEWRLDIQNITAHNNVLDVFFDQELKEVVIPEERIFIPVLSYRVEF